MENLNGPVDVLRDNLVSLINPEGSEAVDRFVNNKAKVSRFDYDPATDKVTITTDVEASKAIDEYAQLLAQRATDTAQETIDELKVRGQLGIDAAVALTADVEYRVAEVPAILPAHSGTTLKVLKEFANNPEVVAKLAEQGLQFDLTAIPPDEICACDTCLEEAGIEIEEPDNVPCDADADGLQMALEMIAELTARFESLEERIEAHNVRASHKI